MVRNGEMLEGVLKNEREPEIKQRVLLISLMAAGIEVEKAIAHFGICVTTGYNWIRRWNSEGIQGLRPKPIPGRPQDLMKKC